MRWHYTPAYLLELALGLVRLRTGNIFLNLALAERFAEAAVRAEVRSLERVNAELTALEGRSGLRLA